MMLHRHFEDERKAQKPAEAEAETGSEIFPPEKPKRGKKKTED